VYALQVDFKVRSRRDVVVPRNLGSLGFVYPLLSEIMMRPLERVMATLATQTREHEPAGRRLREASSAARRLQELNDAASR
jgi:hypothetical protein